MRSPRIRAWPMVFVVAAAGVGGAEPPHSAAPAVVHVRGRVRLPDGSAPKEGAVFALARGRKDGATRWVDLAADGSFATDYPALGGVPHPDWRDRFDVGASVPGFVAVATTVTAEGDHAEVQLALSSDAIEGTLVDADGTLLADVPILATTDEAVPSSCLAVRFGPRRLHSTERGWATPGVVRTDAHGRFRVGVPRGVTVSLVSLSDAWWLRDSGRHVAGERDLRLAAEPAFALRADLVSMPGRDAVRAFQAILLVEAEGLETTPILVEAGEPSGLRLVRPVPTTKDGVFYARLAVEAPDHEVVRVTLRFAPGVRTREERIDVPWVPPANRGRIVLDLGELGTRLGPRIDRVVTGGGVEMSYPVPIEPLGRGRFAAALPPGREHVAIGPHVPFGRLLASTRDLELRPGEPLDVPWTLAPTGSLRLRRTPPAGSPHEPFAAVVRGDGGTASEPWLQGAEIEIPVFPVGAWEISVGPLRRTFRVTADRETVVDLDP